MNWHTWAMKERFDAFKEFARLVQQRRSQGALCIYRDQTSWEGEMSQTLMGYSVGFAAAVFVAIYLMLRYWAVHRHQVTKHQDKDLASIRKAQQPSLSAHAQHPSMDVD
jgi:preprotein translocase subunit SecG